MPLKIKGKVSDLVNTFKTLALEHGVEKLVGQKVSIPSINSTVQLPITGTLKKEFEIIEETLRELYEKTFFDHSGPTSLGPNISQTWSRPRLKVFNQKAVLRKGHLDLSIETEVVDDQGKRHLLWYGLAEGIDPFVMSQDSPPFNIRRESRTQVGSLRIKQPSAFVTENGQPAKRTIKAGQVHPGVKSRGWQEEIADRYKLLIKGRTAITYEKVEYTFKP